MKNVMNMVVALTCALAFFACGGGPVEEVEGAVWDLSDGKIDVDQITDVLDPLDIVPTNNGWSTANRQPGANLGRGKWERGEDGQIVYQAVPNPSPATSWSMEPTYAPAQDPKWSSQTVVLPTALGDNRTLIPIPSQYHSGILAFDIMLSKSLPHGTNVDVELLGQPDLTQSHPDHRGTTFIKWGLGSLGPLPTPGEWHTVRGSFRNKSNSTFGEQTVLTHIWRFSLYIMNLPANDDLKVSIRNLRLIEVIEN